MSIYSGYVDIMTEAAKRAGEIVLSADSVRFGSNVEEKFGTANFVTVYDKKVQGFLFGFLGERFPNANFIGEEDDCDATDKLSNGLSFIIDPIDGTTNFIRGIASSAISIALLENGELICGVVYNPYSGDLYNACKGEGAYCNGKPIKTANTPFNLCVCDCGTIPYYKNELGDLAFEIAKALFMNCADIRRDGSAALDVCRVASGKTDVFIEPLLSPWDYAAGALILTEAGGCIMNFDGEFPRLDGRSPILACASIEIYEKVMSIIGGIIGKRRGDYEKIDNL